MLILGRSLPTSKISRISPLFILLIPIFKIPAHAASCATIQTVIKAGGGTCASIQQCVDNIPSTALSGDWCIDIQDSAVYSEQLTIQNKTPNGFQIVIGTTTGSARPIINPPASSTAAVAIANAGVAIQNITVITTNTVQYGIWISSSFVSISSVNIDAGANPNNLIWGAGIYLSSNSATVSYSSITVKSAHGLRVTGTLNAVSYSTLSANSNSQYGLYLNGASSNTISNCFISSGTVLEANANYNTISLSTMTSKAVSSYALYLNGVSSNTISQSYMFNSVGEVLRISGNASYNTVQLSTMVGSNPVKFAFSSYNTVSQSTLLNRIGNSHAAEFQNADNNTIDLSTLESNNGNPTIKIWGGSQSNTINRSTITGNAAGNAAISITASASTTITDSYIQGSTAVYVAGSTGTIINSSVLVGTNTFGSGLWLADGSVNLSMSSNTIKAGPQGAGVFLDRNNVGSINLSTNTITGGLYGIYIATQTASATLSISNLTISGPLSSGATAVNFADGSFASTLTNVNFSASGIAVNVNAASLSLSSRITMLNYSGSKGGPSFENDPNNLVDWVTAAATNIPPTNPIISSVFLSSIAVSYGTVGADATIVDASTASNFTGSLFSSSSTVLSSLSLQGLALNTTYYLRAGALWGTTTFYANVTPASTVTLAAIPSPLSFTGITGAQLTINWPNNNNPGSTRYEASISTSISFTVLTSSVSTTALNATFAPLVQDTTYFVRVRAFNSAGTASDYSLGAVITSVGVITISANRLPSVWYNSVSSIFNAQGAVTYHYRVTGQMTNLATLDDPVFEGSALSLTLPQGAAYFHVLGLDGSGNVVGTAIFGPVESDTGTPVILSVSGQASATDSTPIADGGSTLFSTPHFSWPPGLSTSPIVGYSHIVTTDLAAQPPLIVNTTLNFTDYSLSQSGLYYFKVRAENLAGTWGPPVSMSFSFSSVPSTNQLLLKHNLFNPLRGECARLQVNAAASGHLTVELYNLLGERVARLFNDEITAGPYNLSWCGRNSSNDLVASGVYVLHIEAPRQKKDFKIFVLK